MRQFFQVSEPDSLPEVVVRLLEHHHLGQIRACYRPRLQRFFLWFFPVWLLSGLSVPRYFFSRAIWPDQNLAPWVVVCAGLAEFLFGVSTVLFEFMGVQPSWWSSACWYVADRGLLFVKGKQSEVVRWDEVQTFFWSNKRSISSLVRPDGSTFRHLHLMDHAHEVSNLVAGVVTERLLPEVLAQYQRVGKVRFGAFVVTQEGVTDWGCSGPRTATAPPIPWHEMEDVRFVRGRLGVQVHGRWKQWSEGVFSLYAMPNPTVGVALLRQILEDRAWAISDC